MIKLHLNSIYGHFKKKMGSKIGGRVRKSGKRKKQGKGWGRKCQREK